MIELCRRGEVFSTGTTEAGVSGVLGEFGVFAGIREAMRSDGSVSTDDCNFATEGTRLFNIVNSSFVRESMARAVDSRPEAIVLIPRSSERKFGTDSLSEYK